MPESVSGTFLEHLDELRRRLWVAVLALSAASCVSLFYADKLLEWVMRPARTEIASLYFFTPSDAFAVKIKLALLSGFLVSSPVILGQFWLFVSPAMHAHERKAVPPFIAFTSALFLTGAAFSFFKVLPMTLHFLIGLQTEGLRPLLSVNEYLSFVSLMVIAFGIAFDLPVFVLILVWTGVLNTQVLNQFQRQMIVLIFIAAAVLTPGPDVSSQLMLAVPLLVLYEVSVLLAFFVSALRRRKRQKALA